MALKEDLATAIDHFGEAIKPMASYSAIALQDVKRILIDLVTELEAKIGMIHETIAAFNEPTAPPIIEDADASHHND